MLTISESCPTKRKLFAFPFSFSLSAAKENGNDGIVNLDSEMLANLDPLMTLCRVP